MKKVFLVVTGVLCLSSVADAHSWPVDYEDRICREMGSGGPVPAGCFTEEERKRTLLETAEELVLTEEFRTAVEEVLNSSANRWTRAVAFKNVFGKIESYNMRTSNGKFCGSYRFSIYSVYDIELNKKIDRPVLMGSGSVCQGQGGTWEF